MEAIVGLSLLWWLSLAPGECSFFVQGEREPPDEVLHLVNLYREDPQGEAVAQFQDLTEEEIEAFREHVTEVRAAARRGVPETAEPEEDCLVATSVLATEAGVEEVDRFLWNTADARFEQALALTDLIASDTRRAALVRDLLLVIGLRYQDLIFRGGPGSWAFERADRYLHAAFARYPEDSEVLLAEGALLEWAGSLRGGDPVYLQQAEELYDRILKENPENPHALLRRGWVQRKRGETAQAEASLRKVTEMPAEDYLIYRAAMGLGGLALDRGDFDGAVALYREAVRRIPRWQMAYIGLSHALHEAGAHEEARDVLRDGLALRATNEAFQGWWTYELGLAPRNESILERLRKEATR